MKKFTIAPMVEFYITNVCNLSCRGCNRFNNYNFKGHQYWDDYAEQYTAWSKRLDIENIWILGGEPTLHPELEKWVSNLRRLWPNSKINIQSNGTYVRDEYKSFWKKYKASIVVAIHDETQIEKIKTDWNHQAYTIGAFVFHESTVLNNNGRLTVHNSDPELAIQFCDMKHDHTMYKGKLYKCPVTAILPDFDLQFKLDLDERQRLLLNSYRPLDCNCSDAEIEEFIAYKDNYIPQCEFCPQQLNWHTALGEYRDNLEPPNYGPI